MSNRITVNHIDIIELDAPPNIVGEDAPIGSLAIDDNAIIWVKYGLGLTDWALLNPNRKSGSIDYTLFTGNPKKAVVTFNRPFPSTQYSISIQSNTDVRVWTFENRTVNGFIINSNANTPLTGPVVWAANFNQETV